MYGNFFLRSTPAPAEDCDALQPLLSLFVDGMASRAERGRVQAHLNSCADCRAALSWMRATADVLATREAVTPPPALAARCRRAWAAEEALAPLPRRAAPPPRGWRPAFAAALSLTVAGFVFGHYYNAGPSVTPPAHVAIQSKTPIVTPTIETPKMPAPQKFAVKPHREQPIAVPKTAVPPVERIALVPHVAKPAILSKPRTQTHNLVAVKPAAPTIIVKRSPIRAPRLMASLPKSTPKLVPAPHDNAPAAQIATNTVPPPAATSVDSAPKSDVPAPQTAEYVAPIAHNDPLGSVRVRLASLNTTGARTLAMAGAVHVQQSFVQTAFVHGDR